MHWFLGKYCDGKGGEPLDCPKGYYCPEGETSFPNQFPCPAGTFNPNLKYAYLSFSYLQLSFFPLSVSLLLSVSLYFSVSLSLSLFLRASFCLFLSVSLSLSHSISIYSLSCSFSSSLSQSFSASSSLDIVNQRPSVCISFNLPPSLSISLSYCHFSVDKKEKCTDCTEGYYCEGGGSEVTEECPAGYYCPPGRYKSQSNRFDTRALFVHIYILCARLIQRIQTLTAY